MYILLSVNYFMILLPHTFFGSKNSRYCADMPLRNCSLTHSTDVAFTHSVMSVCRSRSWVM